MNKISLIALDMDGTLFNSALEISKINQQSIKAALTHGTEVVISTGRACQGIPVELLAELGIKYAITSNGAAIYKLPEKKCIYEDTLPLNIFLPIAEKLSKYDILLHVFSDGQCFNQSSQTSVIEKLPCNEIFKQFLRNAGIEVNNIVEHLRTLNQPIQKGTITFYPVNDTSLKDWDEVNFYLTNHPALKCVDGGVGNLEFTKIGVSKAQGLKFLADYLGIPMEETMACGDSENDLDIIQAAGIGVAMANADSKVKSAADFVSLSNNEDGVAYAIRHFLTNH